MIHTADSVATVIRQRMESDMPDDVLTALRKWHGRAITTRLVADLPGGGNKTWRLVREYGWTCIKTHDYIQSRGDTGIYIMLARSESSVPLDVAWVEQENPAYFSGRRERNANRRAVLNDAAVRTHMALVLTHVATAQAALARATAELDALTEHGEVFNADRYAFRALVGLDKK